MVGYYAIHRETGRFFVAKRTKIAYAGIGYLKSAIRYHEGSLDGYDLYKLEADGTTTRV